MGDMQEYLRQSVPAFIGRLLNPNCVDSGGAVLGVSQNAQCAQGRLEFQPVTDMHIGIVSSSLGGRGSNLCDPAATNPANMSLNAHNDDQGHLINRAGSDEHSVTDAVPSNFLAWLPAVTQNQGAPQPPVPAITDPATLVGDLQAMISGVGEHGCGFEAQLESWYRFLVQPDPYGQIVVSTTTTKATLNGVDGALLQQRHDFLRPDSALAIILLTEENDSTVDPLSIGAQGYLFEDAPWPASPTAGGSPRGTLACTTQDPNNPTTTGPNDPNCSSCAYATVVNMPNYATICPSDPPSTANGYWDPSDDNVNVRMFHMKQRFGLDPQFPVQRYVDGLSSSTVADGAHEHDATGVYAPVKNCTNPIFAAALPTDQTGELCNLPVGPRRPDQVFFAIIAGVPHQLLQTNPSNADSPQKASLSSADWTAILGNDPLRYDFGGADFHMLESESPRAASACPPTATDSCDPVNGREWTTNKGDLQWACVFPSAVARDCTMASFAGSCQCSAGAGTAQTQLCQKDSQGNYTPTQINDAAYPGIRELAVAQPLGAQAVVSSICPIHTTESAAGDPLYAYRPALSALADRLATTLAK